MNSYCGFIEVWKDSFGQTFQTIYESLSLLRDAIKDNDYCKCSTIAIFKIKLK